MKNFFERYGNEILNMDIYSKEKLLLKMVYFNIIFGIIWAIAVYESDFTILGLIFGIFPIISIVHSILLYKAAKKEMYIRISFNEKTETQELMKFFKKIEELKDEFHKTNPSFLYQVRLGKE